MIQALAGFINYNNSSIRNYKRIVEKNRIFDKIDLALKVTMLNQLAITEMFNILFIFSHQKNDGKFKNFLVKPKKINVHILQSGNLSSHFLFHSAFNKNINLFLYNWLTIYHLFCYNKKELEYFGFSNENFLLYKKGWEILTEKQRDSYIYTAVKEMAVYNSRTMAFLKDNFDMKKKLSKKAMDGFSNTIYQETEMLLTYMLYGFAKICSMKKLGLKKLQMNFINFLKNGI